MSSIGCSADHRIKSKNCLRPIPDTGTLYVRRRTLSCRIMTKNVAVLPPFGILALGASAGGVTALISLLDNLPKNLPMPIMLVQHCRSYLPEIVRWHTVR